MAIPIPIPIPIPLQPHLNKIPRPRHPRNPPPPLQKPPRVQIHPSSVPPLLLRRRHARRLKAPPVAPQMGPRARMRSRGALAYESGLGPSVQGVPAHD